LKTKNFEVGVGFTLLSTLCVAFLGLFGKFGLAVDSLTLLVFLRFLFPIAIVFPFLWGAGLLKHITLARFPSQITRCLCVLFSSYCFFYYLKNTSIMNASLLYNTGPVFIPLFGRIFYKHKIDSIEIWAILISIVGVACVVKPDNGLINPNGIFGLLSGIFMAGSQTIYGVNANKEHTGSNLFYLFFLPTLFAIPALFLSPPSTVQIEEIFHHLPMILIFIGLALSSIFNQIFRGYAYQKAPAASLAPFLYFSTIVAALFDWWFFHIPPTFLTVIGFLLILAASILKLFLHKRSAH